jgi:hypothetical protein
VCCGSGSYKPRRHLTETENGNSTWSAKMIDLTAAADARVPYIVARHLASQGLAVFPVRSRQPLTARGVYSATSNLTILSQMRWGNADGCGLATGEVSGIDVLDVDIRARTPEDRMDPPHLYGGEGRDGFAALADLPALPPTLCAQTPRNGRHFYFHHVVGGRNRKLSADGSVEWFSTGKLVVVPPAPGRTWLNQAEIAEAPDWLKALVTAPKPTHTHNEDHGGGSSGPQVNEADLQGQSRDDDRQVPREIYLLILRGMPTTKSQTQRRVRGLWKNLAEKTDHRNDGLNYTAWQFRQFVEAGDLKVEVASKLLRLACEANGYIDKDGPDVIDEMIDRVLQREEVG